MSDTREIQPSYRAVYSVPMALITPGPGPGRYGDAGLPELASSIRRCGLLEPITLRATEGVFYEIVMGERRYRACMMLGYSRIDAFILRVSDAEAALFSLLENSQRQPLHFFETAERYEALSAAGMDEETLSRCAGKSPAEISAKLQLLGLPPETKRQILDMGLTERQAKALLSPSGSQPKRKVISTVWQPRLYLNAIQSLVRQMQGSGIEAQADTKEDGDWMILNIRIRNRK